MGRQIDVAAHDHLANHPRQAHALAVFRAEDACHAITLQFSNFSRHDDTTAAAKHLNMGAAPCAQQVHHVLEVLDVPTLVAADGNALRVFLKRGGNDFVHRAVVPQVDDLGAHALQDAPHDVDGRVVAVKQTRRGDKTHLVHRAVVGKGFELSRQVGHGAALTGGKRWRQGQWLLG